MKKSILALCLFPLSALAGLPENISAVYSYQCEANFVEGEGVRNNALSCVPYQRLGFLKASYTHYLFANDTRNNFADRGTDEWYGYPLCNLPAQMTKCSEGAPTLEFGLSQHQEGEFTASVSFSPSRHRRNEVYGYAALPDRNGDCAWGLEKRWAYVARPASIQYPLPSSFWNASGGLNNWELRKRNGHSPAFTVYREASERSCSASGDCSQAEFGPPTLAQSTPYTQASEAVCVIPADSIAERAAAFLKK